MLDPADCGPVCLSLCQDVQGETFEYPEEFFKERVHNIRRPKPDDFQIKQAVERIKNSKNPIIISGGGVFYSDAMEELSNFAVKHNIPVTSVNVISLLFLNKVLIISPSLESHPPLIIYISK